MQHTVILMLQPHHVYDKMRLIPNLLTVAFMLHFKSSSLHFPDDLCVSMNLVLTLVITNYMTIHYNKHKTGKIHHKLAVKVAEMNALSLKT